MLKASLVENGMVTPEGDVSLSDAQIESLLKETFRQVKGEDNERGPIDFQEYQKYVNSHKKIINHMNIDVKSKMEKMEKLEQVAREKADKEGGDGGK